MSNKIKLEDKKEKSESEEVQDFINWYQSGCKERGYQWVINPAFKAMADTGTFNVVLQTSVGKISRKE